MDTLSRGRGRIRFGGFSLIAATGLFVAVFTYLATTFGYPDVLDHPAAEVLPALRALGATGRIVWVTYGLVPLLLIPTALGVREAARVTAPVLGRLALWLALFSAVSMMIGLLRWPTLHWSLAAEWITASDASRAAIGHRFDTANFYLGNVIGEFAGELFLNAFFLVVAIVLGIGRRRWLVAAGVVTSALGWLAMLRNLTPAVAPIAELNNSVLPVWMLVLGLVMLRTAAAQSSVPTSMPSSTSRSRPATWSKS